MSPDLIMLFVCIAIALVGVLAAAIAFRRHSPGRIAQAAAVVLLPIALYFTGLLRMVVQGAAAVGVWAATLAFSPMVWIGFGLLAVTVVLWVVGGYVARRRRDRAIAAGETGAVTGRSVKAVGSARPGEAATSAEPTKTGKPKQAGKTAKPAKSATPDDDDMAEIEALLKRRGID